MRIIREGKRSLTEDERADFDHAMQGARPLAKRERISHVSMPAIPFMPPWRMPHAPVNPEIPAAPIGGHVEARLRRGRGEPEGRIDLHGLTHDRAYQSLLRFLLSCRGDGKRLVLVITGKGAVLRNSLPLWLGQPELQSLVAGVSEAHASHGGAGAFYVALRRNRR